MTQSVINASEILKSKLKMRLEKYLSPGRACLAIIILLISACSPLPVNPTRLPSKTSLPSPTTTQTPAPTFTQLPTTIRASETASPIPVTPTPEETPAPQSVRFAVIGDYGSGKEAERQVAALVKSWEPEFILTTGDNNYPDGSSATIDMHIGQFFHEFIAPYKGSFGEGAQENRFFPSLGNHDWNTPGAAPYLEYFTLPGNERYYDFIRGPVHFFVLDSDSREPDGVGRSSQQAAWLQSELAASTSAWQMVFFHHGPYSSGRHGPVDWMQWPFAEWGVDVVLSGHDHTYERIFKDGIVYFVNGLGGMTRYDFQEVMEGSQVRYNDDYGAMLVETSVESLLFKFINLDNTEIDTYQLNGK
jgi:tartrate-resistant acid phosphatase type 5